jgi:hypothetical protein
MEILVDCSVGPATRNGEDAFVEAFHGILYLRLPCPQGLPNDVSHHCDLCIAERAGAAVHV